MRTRAWARSFTVRKISFGEGVERVFPLYSPNIEAIDVVRKGVVRRAKLYYLRGRTGKSARIAERRDQPTGRRGHERQPDPQARPLNDSLAERPAPTGRPAVCLIQLR